ncbi:MAG: hypothetical protein Q7S98_01370 [Deltaproteobacteria bacterium]|nr:hypothetical protein [Deltaproteobacteria bacterium]
MVSTITKEAFAVSISDFLEENPLPQIQDDANELVAFDSTYGNGDGQIDLFEYATLRATPQVSGTTLVGLKFNLIDRFALLFGEEPLSFSIRQDRVVFRFENSSEASVHFSPLGSLDEITWEGASSLHYYLFEDTTRVSLTDGSQEIASEEFASSDQLPIRPEELALASTGMLDQVAYEDRHAWLFALSNPGEELASLKQWCRTSHPQLVGRFLNRLLTANSSETERDEELALSIANRLWQSLMTDPQDPSHNRAAQILAEVQNISYQALLLAPIFVENQTAYREILLRIPHPERDNLEHLMKSLKIEWLGGWGETEEKTALILPPSMQAQLAPWLPVSREGEGEIDEEQLAGIREYVDAVEEQNRRKEHQLTQTLQSESSDGEPIRVKCGMTGMDIALSEIAQGGATADKIYEATGLKKPKPEERTPLLYYQKALKLLGRLASSEKFPVPIWRGRYYEKEDSRTPQALDTQTLQYKGGRLTGDWKVWFFREDALNFLRKDAGHFWQARDNAPQTKRLFEEESRSLVEEDGYGVLRRDSDNSGIIVAGKPTSQFVGGVLPVRDGVVFSGGYEKGRSGSIEIRSDQGGYITVKIAVPGFGSNEGIDGEAACVMGVSFQLQALDDEGSCYISDPWANINGAIEVYWPDGKTQLFSKEAVMEFEEERERDLLFQRLLSQHGCVKVETTEETPPAEE